MNTNSNINNKNIIAPVEAKEVKKDIVHEIKETVPLEKPNAEAQGRSWQANTTDSMPKAGEMYHSVAAKACAMVGDKEGEGRHEILADVKRNSGGLHNNNAAISTTSTTTTTTSFASPVNRPETKDMKKNVLHEIKDTVSLSPAKAQAQGQNSELNDSSSVAVPKVGEMYHQVAAKTCALVGDKEGEGRHEALLEARVKNQMEASNTLEKSKQQAIFSKGEQPVLQGNNSRVAANDSQQQNQSETNSTLDAMGKKVQGVFEGVKEFFTGESNEKSDIPKSQTTVNANQDIANAARTVGDHNKAALHENKIEAARTKEHTKENLENLSTNIREGVNNVKGALGANGNSSLNKPAPVVSSMNNASTLHTTTTTTTTQQQQQQRRL